MAKKKKANTHKKYALCILWLSICQGNNLKEPTESLCTNYILLQSDFSSCFK